MTEKKVDFEKLFGVKLGKDTPPPGKGVAPENVRMIGDKAARDVIFSVSERMAEGSKVDGVGGAIIVGAEAAESALVLLGSMMGEAVFFGSKAKEAGNEPLVEEWRRKSVTRDSILFAALFVANNQLSSDDSKKNGSEPMEATHAMFLALRGYRFRDYFLHVCACEDCAGRRRELGVEPLKR